VDGSIEVFTTPEEFMNVKEALIASGHEPENSEVGMVPQTYSLLDAEMSEKVMRLIDHLDDLDDVQNVYTNAEFPEDFVQE